MAPSTSAEHSPAAFYNADALAPIQTRRERLSSFSIEDHNPVSPRSAEWRYTPLDRIEQLTAGTRDGSDIPAVYDITGAASVARRSARRCRGGSLLRRWSVTRRCTAATVARRARARRGAASSGREAWATRSMVPGGAQSARLHPRHTRQRPQSKSMQRGVQSCRAATTYTFLPSTNL